MTKSTKTPDAVTYAEFKELPVWRLNGVTDANIKAVKETELWVHYPRLGDEGWGLIADDSIRKKKLAKLKKHGITAKLWEHNSRGRAVKFILAMAWFMAFVISVNYLFIQGIFIPILIAMLVGAALFAVIAQDERVKYGKIHAQIIAEEKQKVLSHYKLTQFQSEWLEGTLPGDERGSIIAKEITKSDAAPQQDKINGVPLWKMEGVNLETMDIVLKSNAWMHYSDLGDEGWLLLAPEATTQDLAKHFSKHGIAVTPVEKLPYRPLEMKHYLPFAIALLTPFALAFITFPDGFLIFLPLFFVVAIILSIYHTVNTYLCRHIRTAPGLKSMLQWTSLGETNTTVRGSNYHHRHHW